MNIEDIDILCNLHQPVVDKCVFVENSLNSFRESCKDIFYQFFLDRVSKEKWENFIVSFYERVLEIHEYDSNHTEKMSPIFVLPYLENQNVPEKLSLEEKLYWLQKKSFEEFFYLHSFQSLLDILLQEETNQYKKVRDIRSLLSEYDVPSVLFDFEIEQWHCFQENHSYFIQRQFSWKKIIDFVLYRQPLRNNSVKIIETKLSFYSFFAVPNCTVRSVFRKTDGVDYFLLEYFLHPMTHVEDGIVWVKNQEPYEILDEKKNPMTPESLKRHQSTPLSIEMFERIPLRIVPTLHRMTFMNYFQKQTVGILPSLTWKFWKTSADTTLSSLLEKSFHIIGRLDSKYHFSAYHTSFHQKLKSNMLVYERLHTIPLPIVCPEYSDLSKEDQRHWMSDWKTQFRCFQQDFFLNCFSNYVPMKSIDISLPVKKKPMMFFGTNQQNIPIYKTVRVQPLGPKNVIHPIQLFSIESKIRSYNVPNVDRTMRVGSESIFESFVSKKTYIQYFQRETLLPPIESEMDTTNECISMKINEFYEDRNQKKSRVMTHYPYNEYKQFLTKLSST